MRTVNIHAAKTHFSKLVAEVAAGAEVVIAKAGKPVAKLVPIEQKPVTPEQKPKQRPLGVLRGKVWVDPTWDPVSSDPEVVRMFEESDWLPREPFGTEEDAPDEAGGR
jgi:prevent-host-death family protein